MSSNTPESGPWGVSYGQSQPQSPHMYTPAQHHQPSGIAYDTGRAWGTTGAPRATTRECTTGSAVGSALTMVAGAAAGAALMYLLDPEAGERRRHTLAAKAAHAADYTGEALGSAWQRTSDTARHAGHAAADTASTAGTATAGWFGSALHSAREALPSGKSVRHSHANPANWFRHEETMMEKARHYAPSPPAAIGAGTLTVLALGAMYFLDAQSGRRRRALVRDKAIRFTNEAGRFFRVTGRHLANRSRGIVHETTDKLTGRHAPADNRQLEERVRARLGHLGLRSRPDVDCMAGHVKLRGRVLPDDVPAILACVKGTPGVVDVVNHCDVTDHLEPTSTTTSSVMPPPTTSPVL